MTACFITALLAAERASSSVRGEARPQAGVQGNSNSRHQHHKGPPTLTGCLTFASLAFLQKYPQLAPEARSEAGAQGVSHSAELHHQGPAGAYQQSGGRRSKWRQLQFHLSQVGLTNHHCQHLHHCELQCVKTHSVGILQHTEMAYCNTQS